MDERLLKAEAIVFDVGNVLLTFDRREVSLLLPEDKREQLMQVLFGPRHLWGCFDLGAESNEANARMIAREAGLPGSEGDVLFAVHHFHQRMKVLPLAGQLAELKKRGKRLYALTNFPEPSFSLACGAFPFLRENLDGAVVSAREKLVKPDPAIFRLLIRRFQIAPERALFIDDTQVNTEAAAREGFHVWHYAENDRI